MRRNKVVIKNWTCPGIIIWATVSWTNVYCWIIRVVPGDNIYLQEAIFYSFDCRCFVVGNRFRIRSNKSYGRGACYFVVPLRVDFLSISVGSISPSLSETIRWLSWTEMRWLFVARKITETVLIRLNNHRNQLNHVWVISYRWLIGKWIEIEFREYYSSFQLKPSSRSVLVWIKWELRGDFPLQFNVKWTRDKNHIVDTSYLSTFLHPKWRSNLLFVDR